MENRTKTGLFLLLIGLIIGTISNVILSASAFITNFDVLSPIFLGITAILAIGGLIILIGAILIIMDRENYGEKHSKYVIYAVILYIVGIIVTAVISGLISFLAFSSAMQSSMPSGLNGSSAISGFSGVTSIDTGIYKYTVLSSVIGAVFGGLAYIFLLTELENKNGRYILYSAVIASVATASIISLYGMNIIEETINMGSSFSSVTDTARYVTDMAKLSSLSAISSFLLIIAVYIPYNRINTGELKKALPKDQKRCMHCGRIVPFNSRVCAYCGQNLE